MNRVKKIIPLLLLVLLLSACGQKVDENQVVENNATAEVTVEDNVYKISGQTVTLNDKVLTDNIGANEEKIVVLGNKVYFNTDDGTKYINSKGKIKDFGAGRAVYGKGLWLYYVNVDLYRVNVVDGKYDLLFKKDPEDKSSVDFVEETEDGLVFAVGEKNYILSNDADELTAME